jgi:hypothetical protein
VIVYVYVRDGSSGRQGFDPLGIGSWDVLNMNFLREAEIKHGRIAMLAFVGIMVEGAGIKAPGVAQTLGGSNDIFEIHNNAVAKVPPASLSTLRVCRGMLFTNSKG